MIHKFEFYHVYNKKVPKMTFFSSVQIMWIEGAKWSFISLISMPVAFAKIVSIKLWVTGAINIKYNPGVSWKYIKFMTASIQMIFIM